jgi:replication factor C small subunit
MFSDIWVEKYRPQTLEDIILTKEVRDYFQDVKKNQILPNHVLFCGFPGTGKTSLAKIIANDILGVSYLYINASDERGIDVIRQKVLNFAQTKSIDGRVKLIVLDECDGLTSDAQRALRNTMEEYADNARFILTANSISRIISPLKSRVVYFDLVPPLDDVLVRCVEILKKENIKINGEKDKLLAMIKGCYPDLRKAINTISKHIKDGVLHIEEQINNDNFVQKVFSKLSDSKATDNDVRKFIIENETEFNNDYNILLKSLFDVLFNSSLEDMKKREAMLIIGEGLYRHSFVMDFEINCYCTILKLRKLL